MKRRFVSILMALVMALSLLPAQALAEDNTVTELNKSNISNYVTNGLGNGTYKLTEDVTITSTLEIRSGRQVTLDLNDHVLQMTSGGRVFDVNPGCCLTLEDNAAKKTTKYFDRDDTTGLWSWRTDNRQAPTPSPAASSPAATLRATTAAALYLSSRAAQSS